jgi:hypothetical protein
MANPRIEVEIGANVAGLTAGVNTATGQLDKLGKAAQSTAPQVDKLAKSTSQYNSIGIEFSRIIQDAPFGIIGVGNNITQLAGSFQQLRNTSTSTGAALKTAFASIINKKNYPIFEVVQSFSTFIIGEKLLSNTGTGFFERDLTIKESRQEKHSLGN